MNKSNKFLLFAYRDFYPNGGMDDCVFIANSIEELNEYVLKYIGENNDDFDNMHYYDCVSGEICEAEFDICEFDLKTKEFLGWVEKEKPWWKI